MSIGWTAPALAQLRAIDAYLSQASPAAAAAVTARIAARTRLLDGQPYSGGEVPEYGDPECREVLESPYRIIYRVVGPDVQILAVYHGAQQLPRTPPG